MSLLPPKFQDPLLKTLGPPIRKEQENKPVEVEVSPGIWRVNGKLETRFPAPVLPMPVVIDYATIQTEVSEVDIPLPEIRFIGIDCARSDATDAFVYALSWSWK